MSNIIVKRGVANKSSNIKFKKVCKRVGNFIKNEFLKIKSFL